MHLSKTFVSLCGIASYGAAFAMPKIQMLGLTVRDDGNSTYDAQDPCSMAVSPSVNASIQLASWLECQVNGFFPYPANGEWDQVFASAFSKDLLATFNDTRYNYNGWLGLYRSINVTLGLSFSPFKHGFINTLAVPNANGDKGGFAYAIGWEGGSHTALKKDLYFTDATFAVIKEIDGQRKITEFRESSNIPNTAKLPPQNEWTCKFT